MSSSSCLIRVGINHNEKTLGGAKSVGPVAVQEIDTVVCSKPGLSLCIHLSAAWLGRGARGPCGPRGLAGGGGGGGVGGGGGAGGGGGGGGRLGLGLAAECGCGSGRRLVMGSCVCRETRPARVVHGHGLSHRAVLYLSIYHSIYLRLGRQTKSVRSTEARARGRNCALGAAIGPWLHTLG